MLATYYLVPLTPFGETSLAAATALLLAAWLLGRHSPLPRPAQGILVFFSPYLLLTAAAAAELSRERFLSLQFYLGIVIYLSGAFGCALHNLQWHGRSYRVNALLSSHLAILLLTDFAVGWTLHDSLRLWHRDRWFAPWQDLHRSGEYWASLALALTAWLALSVWLYRRAVRRQRRATGQCERCGYDLRGSIGRSACPECGQPF